MISLEEIKFYLPKFLTPENQKTLFEELGSFPKNIDSRMYTERLRSEKVVFQGDGIRDLLVLNLPDITAQEAKCMIFSNTCDVDTGNKRGFFTPRIVYAPILSLSKYRSMLVRRRLKSGLAIQEHLRQIRQQKITQAFYLPSHGVLTEDSLVFMDRVCSNSIASIERKDLSKARLFTLSDYGNYLFLIKLSIHFTRMQDGVNRGTGTLS